MRKNGLQMVFGALFLATLCGLALTPRSATLTVFGLYAAAFGLYLMAAFFWPAKDLKVWLAIAVGARIMLLFIFPNLSDDIYRFIWDGQLWLHGENPYTSIPSEVLAAGLAPDVLDEALYARLNSPHYYTVYPLFPQMTFALAAWIAGGDWYWSAFVMKCVVFAAECLTLRYMYLWLVQSGWRQKILIYALNPLVIIELIGNVHFEALMILGLVAAFFYLRSSRWIPAAGAIVVAIGAKLVPVLALPLLIRRIPLRRLLLFCGVVVAGCAFIFIPVLFGGRGFLDSVGLYFRTFEFNASFYYVARYIGYSVKGFNLIAEIGPGLMAGGVACMLAYLLLEKHPSVDNWPGAVLVVLAIYLAFSTTVHPWYVCPLVAMSAMSRWRFPVVWSGVVFLSYFTYRTETYSQNMWLIACEYTVVGMAIVADIRRGRQG